VKLGQKDLESAPNEEQFIATYRYPFWPPLSMPSLSVSSDHGSHASLKVSAAWYSCSLHPALQASHGQGLMPQAVYRALS